MIEKYGSNKKNRKAILEKCSFDRVPIFILYFSHPNRERERESERMRESERV